MVHIIKKMKNRIRIYLANRNWESKRKYLVKEGATIGKGTRLNGDVLTFGTEPYLITVGENCLFADGVRMITHDGGVKVLNDLNYFEQRMDKLGSITIGNNVYVGMDAFIMPGVTIGNNVIIGAKAIVTHNIPDNSVAVGIPARVIYTIDDYYNSAVAKNVFYPTLGLSKDEKRKYLREHNLELWRSNNEDI
jgi:acetyltransferase-like isoleucine patch superfamily enzyme